MSTSAVFPMPLPVLRTAVGSGRTKRTEVADMNELAIAAPDMHRAPIRRSGRIGIGQALERGDLQPDYKRRMIMLIRV